MPPKGRLSREEKGKAVASGGSPDGGVTASGSPLDEFSLLHRDAMRDTDNMTLAQRFLVADAHRLFREEGSHPVVIRENANPDREEASVDREGPVDEGPSEPRPRKRKRLVQSRLVRNWRPELQDCRPWCYHDGGLVEELPALPPEALRDPYAKGQDWDKIVGTCSTHSSVRKVLQESGGAGVTYIIPSSQQRPWSPPVGYHCLFESYFQEDTKLWFPVPRLVTSYAFRRDIAMCQLVNGSYRIAVALMVIAAEVNLSLSVRAFEELTTVRVLRPGLFSLRMRPSYNILTGHPNKTKRWRRSYFYVQSDEFAFAEPPKEDFRVLWNRRLGR